MNGQPTEFLACASHPDLGEGTVEGRIVLDRFFFSFVCSEFTLQVPLNRLELDLDVEGAGQRVRFSDPEQPDVEVFTYDLKILKHPAVCSHSHIRAQIRAVESRGDLKKRLKITGWFLLGFALLAFGGTLFTGYMVRALVNRVPVEWEKKFGDDLLKEVKQEESLVFVEDSRAKARVESAVRRLVDALPKSGLDYRFYIVRDPLPNAFALPGGHVLINTGLLDLTDTPEELAGAVAHEIAHVTQKHGFRKIIAAAGPYLICRLFVGDGSGLLGVLGDGSELLLRQSFSQEYELEADAVGWQYLVKARIDPRGMTEVLRKLNAEERRLQSLQLGAFSSHPATEKRIRRLEAKWKKLSNSTFEPLPKSE